MILDPGIPKIPFDVSVDIHRHIEWDLRNTRVQYQSVSRIKIIVECFARVAVVKNFALDVTAKKTNFAYGKH